MLKKILKIFDLRKVRKIIARYTSLKAIPVLKIVTTSMFFSTRISHVINELKQRKELREFLRIKEEEVPKEGYVYA
ncbi:IS5/IS1182 family transposase, partial [Archaeoglobales archaeon]